ncbi:MAG TPA: DUF222 domain-containing protein [Streptosporangiaceae bacterium]
MSAGPAPVGPALAPAAVLAGVLDGLGILARSDWASVASAGLSQALTELERAESMLTAARSAVLSAFTAQRGFEDDGQGSPRSWLAWQARITRGAASDAVSWARRLAAHPAYADGLAGGWLSASWARTLAGWSDLLPEDVRAEADVILAGAAKVGADLADLSVLAEQIRRHTAVPDPDPDGTGDGDGSGAGDGDGRDDDGFGDRGVYLATTLGGAGRLTGDLTARCAAAFAAVLDSLGKKAGPEDTRTAAQRRHDALEEACRRLLGSGCLPDRAGQPVQLQLHQTLDDFLHGHGHPGPGDGNGRGTGGPAEGPEPGWPGTAPAGPGDDCDAAVAPIVTGRIDFDLLDRLAARMRPGTPLWTAYHGQAGTACQQCGHVPAAGPDDSHQSADGSDGGADRGLGRQAARRLLLETAVALLSGPDGLASLLRTGALPPPAGSVSLPLDLGVPTELVPPHLRRAIIARDKHCAAPGCTQPPAACHVHHIIPRSKGGPTSLANCILLCSFHHQILIHRWGWTITLHPDGTTTVTSPGGKQLHSHSPPPATAA